ncbi:MAG TPA: hypothetical protein VHV32_02015 [Candidatus Angelobacter sp.]|nr:hypothetical protein [Candidatus Angelobacter sp.]
MDFLEQYPAELVALRRDLARVLLQDVKLSPEAERLMETLALAGVGLPASVLVAAGFSETEFQQAIAQCASAGLITADVVIETHPLFQEFYWHRLHRSDYRERSLNLAEALRIRLNDLDKASHEFASLLPVIFRSYALAGELEKATALRRDLSGELEATALTLITEETTVLLISTFRSYSKQIPKTGGCDSIEVEFVSDKRSGPKPIGFSRKC